MAPRPDDLHELLAHEPFVRALARRLVLDGVRADDVVQQTWLAALGADRSRIGSVRSWLAAIVRRVAATMRRAEARAELRERRAARPEAEMPAEDARAREDARRAVVDAVFALEEPWRTTLILRHLDGLPQREIARRTGVPVETVHSRLRRGLELLRQRLDARFDGDRRSWLLGLVPFAAQPGTVPIALLSSAALHGTFVMAVQLKVVVAAVAITVAGCWWFIALDRREIDAAAPAAVLREAESAAAPAPPDLRDVAGGAERAVVPGEAPPATPSSDPSSATTGAIEVTLRTRGSSPDSGVVVLVTPTIESLARPSRASATGGVLRFERLAPGAYTVSTDRFVEESCVVEPGATARVTLDLTAGFRVAGRVVDPDGAGVAGATITLSRSGRGQESFDVGVSGADGEFAIDGLGAGAHVGATKAGFAASMLRYLVAGPGEQRGDIELRLRHDGGAIAGRVLDVKGAPLPGARVVADADGLEFEVRDDGTPHMDVFERFAWSAADGTFRLDGLVAREHKVVVRADGFAPFVATLATRAGETTRLDATLAAGAIVSGIVRGKDGAPAAGVPVAAGRDGTFAESSTGRSDAEGAYRLESLPAGRVVVVAGDATRGSARVEHDAISGVEQRVDLLLETGPGITGRVEDEFGRAVAGARLDASRVEDRARVGTTTTSQDGSFRVACRGSEVVDLVVYWSTTGFRPALRVRDVRAGTDSFVIRLPSRTLPSARIVGRVEDVDGPVAGAEALIVDVDGPQGLTVLTAADGSFASPLLPPGRYAVSVRSTARAVHTTAPIVLDANATHDAGTIRLTAGGSLLVRIRRAPELRDSRFSVWFERAGDGGPVFLDKDGDIATASKLEAGSYVLSVGDGGVLAQSETIAIQDGEETQVELALERAATLVRFVVAAASLEAETIRVRVDEAGGRRVHSGVPFRMSRQDPFEHEIGLNPGAYRVTLLGPHGVTATREIEVAEKLEKQTFELSLP